MIVCDTGPLVAAALANDMHHAACVSMLTELHQDRRDLLIPAPVVAEVGYLLAREAGRSASGVLVPAVAYGWCVHASRFDPEGFRADGGLGSYLW